jgi:hypothetical protein
MEFLMLMNQQLFHNRDQPNLGNKFENIDIRKKENSRCRSSVVGIGNKSLASCTTRRRRATAAFESRLLSSYKNKKFRFTQRDLLPVTVNIALSA